MNDCLTRRPFAPRIDNEMAIVIPSDQALGQDAGSLYDLIAQSLEKVANKSDVGDTDAK